MTTSDRITNQPSDMTSRCTNPLRRLTFQRQSTAKTHSMDRMDREITTIGLTRAHAHAMRLKIPECRSIRSIRSLPPDLQAAGAALAAIRNAGVILRMEGPRLMASPRAAVTADLAALITAHRDALTAILAGDTAPEPLISPLVPLAAPTSGDIAAALARLPAPSSRDGARLLSATRDFVRAPEFAQALAAGWTEGALFALGSGEHPAEAATTAGLVPWWALHWPSAQLIQITTDGATLERIGGGRVWRGRLSAPDIERMSPWWETATLIGEAE